MKQTLAVLLFLLASAQQYKPQVGIHVGDLIPSPRAKAIDVHPHEVAGVEVALLDVKRTAPDAVMVKVEYWNTTRQIKQLPGERYLRPHQTWTTTVKVAAPEGAKSVDVYVPGVAAFTNVPLK